MTNKALEDAVKAEAVTLALNVEWKSGTTRGALIGVGSVGALHVEIEVFENLAQAWFRNTRASRPIFRFELCVFNAYPQATPELADRKRQSIEALARTLVLLRDALGSPP